MEWLLGTADNCLSGTDQVYMALVSSLFSTACVVAEVSLCFAVSSECSVGGCGPVFSLPTIHCNMEAVDANMLSKCFLGMGMVLICNAVA